MVDKSGNSDLHLACLLEVGDHLENAAKLLCHGSDVWVENSEGLTAFDIAIQRSDFEMQELLFDFIFDNDKIPLKFNTVFDAIRYRSPLFPKIINKTSKLIHTDSDFDLSSWTISKDFCCTETDYLKLFIENFRDDVIEMIEYHKLFERFLHKLHHSNKECDEVFIEFLFSDLIHHIIAAMNERDSQDLGFLIFRFNDKKIPLDIITKVILHLLSYGAQIYADDLNCIYDYYGKCDLFNICLHMDIKEINENSRRSVMAALMFDIGIDLSYFFRENRIQCLLLDDEVERFFSWPALVKLPRSEGTHVKDPQDLPNFPSLLELSRDVSRDFIIKKYKVKNAGYFYAVVNHLPIPKICREIISYELPLY